MQRLYTGKTKNLNNAQKLITVKLQTFYIVQCLQGSVSVPKRLKMASFDLYFNSWLPLWPRYNYRKTETSLPLSFKMRKEKF